MANSVPFQAEGRSGKTALCQSVGVSSNTILTVNTGGNW